MADIIFLSLTVLFFGLAGGLVRGCEVLIGPDESDDLDDGDDE